jgi:threonine/homoserine/homoserine lactone efflux protein
MIEFFQFVAIAPELLSLKIVVRILSNLFLLDIVKMASSDKSGYWTLLITICVVCFVWFMMVASIMLNVDKVLSRFPFIQRVFQLFNGAFLPFFGNTMFLPFATLLLDAYVCDHKA